MKLNHIRLDIDTKPKRRMQSKFDFYREDWRTLRAIMIEKEKKYYTFFRMRMDIGMKLFNSAERLLI